MTQHARVLRMESASQTPSAAPASGSTKLSIPRVRTPWWRRLTALISLSSLVVIIGIIVAVALGLAFLLTLLLLERAAG